MATRKLTIYASDPGVTDPDRMLTDRDEFDDVFRVNANDGNLIGVVYTQTRPITPPEWQSFLQRGIDQDLELMTTHSSAVLLVQVRDRLFAIPFGYGYAKLNDAVIDQRFGLRVTLNAIEEASIRSIDRKIFGQVHRQAREQASVASEIDIFGINTNRDLLRAVTGSPEDDAPGSQMTGKDRLSLRIECTIDDLPRLLEDILELSEQATYAERFSWVDRIKEIKAAEHKQRLNIELSRRIAHEDLEHIWLVPPEIIDWPATGGFKYRQAEAAGVFADLHWEDYFSDCRSPGSFRVKHLRQDRVRQLDADEGLVVGSFSLGRCIAAEIRLDDDLYVHSDRSWYQIDPEFAQSVDQSVGDLDTTDVDLPPYGDDDEASYNERVARESNGFLCVMDRHNIRPSEGEDWIEFCDLYSRDGHLVHVKRYGGSSTLSHLFAQGRVSARTLFAHRGFRENVADELPETHQNVRAERVDPTDFEVAYAVIAKPGKNVRLPFFARVDLRDTVRALEPTGCRVTLTPIQNQTEAN